MVLKGLCGLCPFLHNELMRNLQLVQDETEDLYIIAIRFTLVVSELVWREFPVTDDDQWALFGIFTRQLGSGWQQTVDTEKRRYK
jgi:hypothetical protein